MIRVVARASPQLLLLRPASHWLCSAAKNWSDRSMNNKSPKRATPKKLPTAIEPNASMLSKAAKIAAQLQELYPEPPIPLTHASPFQLLVAVMLSAQTTDKKVNEVTPQLFQLAPDASAMAQQDVAVVQKIIQPIGLAPTKARNVVSMAQLLLERHAGEVPNTFEQLEALPGVGHKTASVVMAQAFGHAAFPVDTHIHRLAERWGLSSGKSVEQTEADLKALLPSHLWRDIHLQIIYFGREYCSAKQHDSKACPICCWASVTTHVSSSSSNAAANNKSKAQVLAAATPGAASRKPAAPKRKNGKAVTTATTAAEAGAAATAAEAAAVDQLEGLSKPGNLRPTRRRRVS